MDAIVPCLLVRDVAASCAFYERLELELTEAVTADGESVDEVEAAEACVWAQLRSGDVELQVQEVESARAEQSALADVPIGGSFTLYCRVGDVDALVAGLDADSVVSPPEETWYGMREAHVHDPDDYLVALAAPVA